MGRPKKEKPVDNFANVYKDYIVAKIVPFVEEHIDEIESIFSDFSSIDKEKWNTIKEYVETICEYAKEDESFVNPFKSERIEGAKYKKEHSSYYVSVAGAEAKYIMNRIKLIKTGNAEKGSGGYINNHKIIATHLFFFVACPEKI